MGQELTAITNIISFNPPNNNMSYYHSHFYS